MSGQPANLARLQRWMQAVIMHPDGVEGGVGSPEARRLVDIALDQLEQVIHPSRALGSAERLEIYVDAYHLRLMDCLRNQFPALVNALGEATFDAVAFGYLGAYPSRGYSLNKLGENLPQFLAQNRPHESAAPADAPSSWPDGIIELSTFERAVQEIFDGPGVEGQRLLEQAELSAIAPLDWPGARLKCVECLRLFRFAHPVNAWYSQLRHVPCPPPGPCESHVALVRQDYTVRRHELSRPQYELLLCLAAGSSIASGMEAALGGARDDVADLAVQVQGWFQQWATGGFFSGVQ
ncbi:MAG: DNA-binding domain-containing protein [Pirellulales bacterium]